MRIAHLDKLEVVARGRPLTIEQIHRGHHGAGFARRAVFLRLLGRAFSEPVVTGREIRLGPYLLVVIRFKDALMRSLPDKPDQELTWRMHFTYCMLSYGPAGDDSLKSIAPCNLEGADGAQAVRRGLIRFLAAGLKASLPGVRGKGDPPGRRRGMSLTDESERGERT